MVCAVLLRLTNTKDKDKIFLSVQVKKKKKDKRRKRVAESSTLRSINFHPPKKPGLVNR